MRLKKHSETNFNIRQRISECRLKICFLEQGQHDARTLMQVCSDTPFHISTSATEQTAVFRKACRKFYKLEIDQLQKKLMGVRL